MNVFGEVLTEILEYRGEDLNGLALRANLDAGELRAASTDTDPDRATDPRMIPAVCRALALSEKEVTRLRWAYYVDEHRAA